MNGPHIMRGLLPPARNSQVDLLAPNLVRRRPGLAVGRRGLLGLDRRDERHPIRLLRSLARSFLARGKPVAAICHGPWLLASSGAIRGRRLTSFWRDGVPEDVRAAGGLWQDADVVVDGNLVTSRWPPDLPVFTRAMMAMVDAYMRVVQS